VPPIATATLGDLLHEPAGGLRGRSREVAALLQLVNADRPLVLAVHGLAGSGKTALLRAFAREARALGAAVVVLDGLAIEPTEAGFRAALAAATGGDELGGLADRVVLAIDGAEHLGMLDAWLVRELLPGLPANARLLLASRERPSGTWSACCGSALHTLALGGLPPPEAERLLREAGVDPDLDRVAYGHPLTLQLAIAAARSRPGVPVLELAVGATEHVAATYLDGLDEATGRALAAAAVTRRMTVPLLAAMLPGESAQEAFTRLRALRFVALGPDGLVVDDTLRRAAAARLRASDPAAHRRLRIAAFHHLREELQTAEREALWRVTADLLYLVERPIVQQFFFPATVLDGVIEPARPEDWPAIAAIAATEREVDMSHIEDWWHAVPGAFAVARGGDGEVLGVRCMVERGDIPAHLFAVDPVAARLRDHLRRDPVPASATATLLRYLAIRDTRDAPTVAQALLLLDLQSACVARRPHLRRTYATEPLLRGAEGRCAMTLGYVPMPGQGAAVPVAQRLLYNDYGPGSIDGWLVDLAARELGIAKEGPVDPVLRRLALDGDRVDLTQLEFDVLHYLQEHEGRPVSREALLRDVWGYAWSGGSNVVEVAISGLRKKLGDHAGALRTVRGVGYRLDLPT